MGYDETLDLLEEWAGRPVSAAVRVTCSEVSQPVAVFRGRLGSAEGEPVSEVFFPISLGDPLDGATGLRLRPAEFEEAVTERDHLYLQLEEAIVELTPA